MHSVACISAFVFPVTTIVMVEHVWFGARGAHLPLQHLAEFQILTGAG
jgi:hypothetical protein